MRRIAVLETVVLMLLFLAIQLQAQSIDGIPTIFLENSIVLGQNTSMSCSSFGTSPRDMKDPGSAAANGNTLFVADSGGNRIMVFNNSTNNYFPASSTIGGGLSSTGTTSLFTVRISPGNLLWFGTYQATPMYSRYDVSTIPRSNFNLTGSIGEATSASQYQNIVCTADARKHRAVCYDISSGTANQIFLFGQNDNTSDQPNKDQSSPDATTLYSPTFITSECGRGWWVSDITNNRILRFQIGNTTADVIIGQPTPTSKSSVRYPNNTANSLNFPHGIVFNYDCTFMWVADTGGDRILKYQAPFVSNMSAIGIFGGGNGGCSSNNVRGPKDVAIDGRGRLWIVDTGNQRVIGGFTNDTLPPLNSSFSTTPSVTTSTTLSPSTSTVNSPSSVPGASISNSPSSTPSFSSSVSISSSTNNDSSLSSSPSSSSIENPSLSCDLVQNSICYIDRDVNITSTLSLPQNYSELYINGSLSLSSSSRTVLSSDQTIIVSGTTTLSGQLTIVLRGDDTIGNGLNLKLITFNEVQGSFSSVEVVGEVATKGCGVEATPQRTATSLSVLISKRQCGEDDMNRLSGEAIAGIVIGSLGGAVICILVVAGLLALFVKLTKMRRIRPKTFRV
eukprot:TRINITY_DN2058_c0_g1_i1.p1 TRINITY_DN2058_c0_g1~~TRINITY_DN2058_c0_g1_i1.p1  ORF type:complete len:619 (+),score=113.41 TRINITY_DN2058_c0_g1_i1:73-1929(+)